MKNLDCVCLGGSLVSNSGCLCFADVWTFFQLRCRCSSSNNNVWQNKFYCCLKNLKHVRSETKLFDKVCNELVAEVFLFYCSCDRLGNTVSRWQAGSIISHNATCLKPYPAKTRAQLRSSSPWLGGRFKCPLFSGPSFLKGQNVRASSMSSGGTLSPRQRKGSYFQLWAICHPSRSLMVASRQKYAMDVVA